MKILFVSSLYHPHVGGIETFITELATELKKRGILSSILTKRWPETLSQHSVYRGIDVYRITSAKTRSEFLEIISYLKKYERVLRADVIHVVGLRRPLPLIALLLARRWGVPLIVTIAGSEIPDTNDPSTMSVWRAARGTAHPVLKQADAVTAFSKTLARLAHRQFPDVQNIRVLYAGMYVNEFFPSPKHTGKRPYILSLRRLTYSKGIDLLIQAFANLDKCGSDLKLRIAGAGPEKRKLVALAKKLGIKSRVEFIGTVSMRKAAELLRYAQLTVVPSRSEGGGLVNIEAQAAGCPLVASRAGGIPEYVKDGKTVLLHKVNDVHDLRLKIEKILKHPVLRNTLVKNGIRFARTFDWSRLCPPYVSLYRNLSLKHSHRRFHPWSPLSRALWKILQKTHE